MKTIKDILAEVATLQRPVTAAAILALIVSVIPGIGAGAGATEISAILVAVGTVAAFAEKFLPGTAGKPAV